MSMLEHQVLKAICQKDNFNNNKNNLCNEIFSEGNLSTIYDLIVETYMKYPDLECVNKNETDDALGHGEPFCFPSKET